LTADLSSDQAQLAGRDPIQFIVFHRITPRIPWRFQCDLMLYMQKVHLHRERYKQFSAASNPPAEMALLLLPSVIVN